MINNSALMICNLQISLQDRLIANSAWRDYSSGANTNFAFETYEGEEKAPPPPVSSLPRARESMMNVSNGNGNGHGNGNGTTMVDGHHRPSSNNNMSSGGGGPRTTYSLPRAPRQPPPPPQVGYYTQDRRNNQRYRHSAGPMSAASAGGGANQPDFYFMPSQRKYSGEVVRVYVDYGNQKQK